MLEDIVEDILEEMFKNIVEKILNNIFEKNIGKKKVIKILENIRKILKNI